MKKVTCKDEFKILFLCRRGLFIFIFSLILKFVSAQKTTISGVVLDENSVPYVGAHILLQNTEYGTTSDDAGHFIFRNIPDRQYKLNVSATGYEKNIFVVPTDSSKRIFTVSLHPLVQALNEVQVKCARKVKVKTSESINIQIVDREYLREAKSGNLMQTLEHIPGVNAMNIGTGVSKPIIRGMGTYRVVFAENGIKQEGQQWSSHQGISIDQERVHQVEIIKGPAALQYGSGAIGGVINILPTDIPLKGKHTGAVSFQGKTNTRGFGGSGNFSFREADFYCHTTLTHQSYGDFIVPETNYFLLPVPVSSDEASHKIELGKTVDNTSGNENAVSITAGIVKGWGNSYLELSYHQNTSGFFDWQGLQSDSLRSVHQKSSHDIQLPYQEVCHFSINHFTNRYFNENKLQIAIGYQENKTNEHSYLLDRTGNRTDALKHFESLDNLELALDLKTLTGNITYSIHHIEKQILKLGIHTQFQNHTIDGYNHILPKYHRSSVGGFVTHRYSFSSKWVLNSGFRFDQHFFEMEESLNPDPAYGNLVFNPHFKKEYPGISFSGGVNFLPNKSTLFKANIGKSYRIPSAYELGAYGLHRHNARFEKGDITIEPEQAWQLDFGYEKQWRELKVAVYPFLNYFSNYLFLNPSSELRPEGQVFEYRQNRAMLSGGEASLDCMPVKRINLRLGLEYIYAVNLDLHRALPLIPPLSVQSKINYWFKNTSLINKACLGFEAKYVAAQKYTVPNELTTPGYVSFNIDASKDVFIGKQLFNMVLKVNNLFNNRYFNHISFYRRLRIPEPGRDLQLYITMPF